MFKKIFLVTLVLVSMLSGMVCAGAQTATGSIVYTDADGKNLTSYTEGEVTAKATWNSQETLNPVLVITSYVNGLMNGIWYKKSDTTAKKGEMSYSFTPSSYDENTVIKAVLMDGMKTINPLFRTAQMLNDTTNLKGILVDGAYLDGYSNDEEFYVIETQSGEIVPVVEDSGTTTEVVMPETIPGYGSIYVTSPCGSEREIEFLAYNSYEQLYSLKSLKYFINGEEYVMDWIESDVTEYEIEVDPNTFYVTVEPELYMEGATATVKVQDIDYTKKTFGGISYINGNANTAKAMWSIRKCFNNVIPIKNEATKAIIEVNYEGNVKTYVFTFTCVQPRLTSFNITEGAFADSYKPSFVGGAALNNDNGSNLSTDRYWAYTNVSDVFIGGSTFLIPAASNRSADTWYGKADGDEYFNFTTDTPGTIYMLMSTAIAENNLTENYANDGWECLQTVHSTGYKDKNGFTGLGVDFNDYKDNIYTVNFAEFQNTDQRYNLDTSYVNPPANQSVSVLAETYKRDFAAGEEVKIYHIGKDTYNGNVKSNVFFVIVWDLEN